MHHSHDGWYFDRHPDGSVRIIQRETARADAPIISDVMFTPDEWADAIASVSAGGDRGDRFYMAKKFHDSEGDIDVVSIPKKTD